VLLHRSGPLTCVLLAQCIGLAGGERAALGSARDTSRDTAACASRCIWMSVRWRERVKSLLRKAFDALGCTPMLRVGGS
jgi:hypothetical protein